MASMPHCCRPRSRCLAILVAASAATTSVGLVATWSMVAAWTRVLPSEATSQQHRRSKARRCARRAPQAVASITLAYGRLHYASMEPKWLQCVFHIRTRPCQNIIFHLLAARQTTCAYCMRCMFGRSKQQVCIVGRGKHAFYMLSENTYLLSVDVDMILLHV